MKMKRTLSILLCLCMVLGMLPRLSSKAVGTDGMITIEMRDSYGDGWNGNAIEVYANDVLLDTATLTDGSSGTWSAALDVHATYTLKWVSGSYASETSFVVYVGTEEMLSGGGSSYSDGDVLLTLEPTCSEPKFENGICVNCGIACVHSFADSVCAACGFACGTDAAHNWDKGVCTVCAIECAHAEWEDNVCGICGYACGSDVPHSFADSVCAACGFACGTHKPHDWQDGSCTVCALDCAHESVTDGVCDTCSGACGSVFAHSFNSEYICTVCGSACGHAWQAGTCTLCGRVCVHTMGDDGFCTVCDDYQAATDADEDGYYDIANAGNLYWFAQQVNSGSSSIKGELTADIVVNEDVLNADGTLKGDGSGLRVWTPIGSRAMDFNGSFNGNDYSISGLYYSGNGQFVGLFGYADGGSIENVGVVDSYFYSSLSFCDVSAVVGFMRNTSVVNCYNTGTISGNDAGGIVAYSEDSSVTDCYNAGCVIGSDYVGGVIGYAGRTPLTNCYNTGSVTSSYGNAAGGVVGSYHDFRENPTPLTHCYNTGDVVNTYSYGSAGGVVGSVSTDMYDCYSTGAVSADRAGGIAGILNSGTITLSDCYYNSDVFTGEAVGENYGTVTNCPGLPTQQFFSGEVCWLLNGSSSEGVWKQTLGTELSPNFTGDTVYQVSGTYCTGEEGMVYSNTNANAGTVHKDETNDHLCDTCGETATSCSDWNADHLCDLCGEVFSQHSGGVATCNAKAKCSYCGAEYGETNPLKHDSSVDFDAKGFCQNGCYEPAEGSGTEAEPYQISNPGQLYWFAAVVNSGYGDTAQNKAACAVLTNNIEVNANVLTANGTLNSSGTFRGWTPIGNNSNKFIGTFDGKGFTISGLYYDDNTVSYVGLVGYLHGGTVKDVGVEASFVRGGGWTGAVVGAAENGATVSGCYNTGIVYSRGSRTGGVVGSNNGSTVSGCYNTGTVNSTSTETGGVVGYSYNGTVTNCYNTAPLKGYYVGGIVGLNTQNSTVTNCYNIGKVTGSGYAGAIVGGNRLEASISNCYYLDTSASWGESGGDVAGATQAVSEAQFTSGEVAYSLGEAWGQKIGEESYPVLGGERVYYGYTTCDENQAAPIYSNAPNAAETKPTHSGGEANCQSAKICTLCGAEYGEKDPDNHGDALQYEQKYPNNHTATCSGCGVSFVEEHEMDHASGQCPQCKRPAAASVTSNGTTLYYFYIGQAIEAVSTAVAEDKAVVTLLQTTRMGDSYTEVTGGVFTLDLNGYYFTTNNSYATVIARGGNVTLIDSVGTGCFGGYPAVRVYDGASFTISSGEVKGFPHVCVGGGSSVVINGGTFSTTYASNYDINNEDGTGNVTLTVGENGVGPTFVDGIRVKGTTLEEILGEGMAYWQNGKQVTLTEGQTEITGGDVTVKAACPHSEGTSCDDNGDGTHSDICTVCGTVMKTEPHSMTKTDCQSIASCTLCFAEGTYGDHSFDENGICGVCGKSYTPAEFYSHSLDLSGKIAINYYMLLSEAVLADPTAYMQFTMANGQVIQIPVAEGVERLYKGVVYHVFTCGVSAKEMTDDVKAQFFYEGGATAVDTYSVKTYVDNMRAKNEDEALMQLLDSMLHYGAASQIQFGYHTERLANEGLQTPDYSAVSIEGYPTVKGQGTERVKFVSATLVLLSETTLRLFFRAEEGVESFTVSYNGEELALTLSEQSGRYYADITNISAPKLDETVTVTVSEGGETAEVAYSPMAYCASVHANAKGQHSATLQDTVAALYLYSQAANAYFESN